jgi:hypothetical protein
VTRFDLNLNTSFRNQYLLARFLYRTFTLDFNLALNVSSKIDYDPENPQAENLKEKFPQKYRRQGVVLGFLDQAVDGLILKDEFDATPRIVTYGEFYNTYFGSNTDENNRKTADFYKIRQNTSYLFVNLHPKNHPVLWRILIAQAHICRLIMQTYTTNDGSDISSKIFEILIQGDEVKRFDWRQEQDKQTMDEVFNEPYKAVREYFEKIALREYRTYSRGQ